MRMRKIIMLITSVRVEIQLNLKNVHWIVFEGQQYGTNKNSPFFFFFFLNIYSRY